MPILTANNLEIFSRSPAQTRRVGMRLGELLSDGDTICLVGDLGAGKTAFVQGLAAGWGSPDPATSPTFVLINSYRHPNGSRLHHLDAYRLSGPQDAVDLDLDLLHQSGPVVIEWADQIKAALPRDNMWIELRWVADEHRGMVFNANGKRYQDLVARLRKQIYAV
jgi:tRNA threonylcarbamoyladenosine biosynthesis protein TsaE